MIKPNKHAWDVLSFDDWMETAVYDPDFHKNREQFRRMEKKAWAKWYAKRLDELIEDWIEGLKQ